MTPSAVPYWPQASGPVLQWVRIRTGRPSGTGRTASPKPASRPWSVVASKTIASASARMRVRDRVAVVVELADLDVPGHDPVDRPAQVDRGRPGVDQRVGRATDDRLARVREPVALLLGGHRQPDRGDLADRRGAADDHLADRVGDLPGRSARVLDERVGQPALVDEVDDPAVFAERRPEPGRAARGLDRRVAGRSEEPCRAFRVEDRARRVGRCLLERLRGAGHGGRRLDELARERPEEPPAPHVDRGGRRERPRAAPPGRARARRIRPRRARPERCRERWADRPIWGFRAARTVST